MCSSLLPKLPLFLCSMAQVLSFPLQPDGGSHFGSSSLQRSSSHSSLLLQNSAVYPGSPGCQKSGYSHLGYDNRPSTSLPSSAPSSPRLIQPQFSNQPSYTSTPSSSLSLDESCYPEDEDIHFPSYGTGVKSEPGHVIELSKTLQDSSTHVRNPSDGLLSSLTLPPKITSKSGSSGSAGDDMDAREKPTRHVDYLSHSWKEEDIWASWRHIVTARKSYSNSTRLENASWRTWAKSKYRLKTVSPETLNWYVQHISSKPFKESKYTHNVQDEGPRRNLVVWPTSKQYQQIFLLRLIFCRKRPFPN